MGGMKWIVMAVLLVVYAPSWLRAEEPLSVVKGIRVFRSGDGLGVEISADKDVTFTCTKMPQLLKIIVDLPRTDPGRPDIVYKYKSALISDVRLEKKTINNVPVTRVSVNLAEDADFTAQVDPSDSRKMTLLLHKSAPVPSAAASLGPRGKAVSDQQAASGKLAAPAATLAKDAVKNPGTGNHLAIQVTGVSCGRDGIEIKSGAAIAQFKAFTLKDPGRLIIDIPGAQSALRSLALPANRFGFSQARFGLFEGKLRVVFDAGAKPLPGYEVVPAATGLRVVRRD
jgi:hypothetical protein